jgi:demethylmenaquinone methyltransferase / 2-methoxy-6-polyprenyl-1,4-benzoquinol methylase
MTVASPVPSAPTPGDPEKDAVREMFDRIAPRYDLLNRLLSGGTDARWRRAAVDMLEMPGPLRVLDLCTGTGDLLGEALRRDPRSRGAGVDLSRPMLERGRAKLAGMGLGRRASLCAGDVERLPFTAGAFDAALVAFGIRNVRDRQQALGEVARVLRPGGRLVVLEFSMPSGLLGALYRAYFGQVLPRLGSLVSGHPGAYRYLPDSVVAFPPPPEFARLMAGCGFGDVAVRRLTMGIAQLYRGERR